MTTESNSVNSNSDFGLLNLKDGWLNSKPDSFQCGCIVCQGTAITSIEHQEIIDCGLPFVDDSSTENNISLNDELYTVNDSSTETEIYPTCGLPFADDSSTVNHTHSGGGIPYVEPPPNNNALQQPAGVPPVDYANTFKLHSKTDSNFTIYLDFDGHVTENTIWKNGARIESPAFDYMHGDVSSFSDAEKEQIQKIWQEVAEDFAPFDINVTTEEPNIEDLRKTDNSDQRWGIRVVLTQDNETNISPGAGGVAYINSFNWSSDTPAFAFNKTEDSAGITVSHEVGHALGLSHDGADSTEYYPGHGTGDTSWGPIMGAPFNSNVTQWSKGEYYLANNTGSSANFGSGEDDLEIITTTNGFDYRVDDHGNTNATASELTPTTNTISAFGIIERNTDVDVFSFVTGTGDVSLTISPSSKVYISDGNGGYTIEYLDSFKPNLDISTKLYKADGSLVAQNNPADSLFASFDNLSLDAGEYYIHIDGVGTGTPNSANPTGYTDYGSLGQYEINGTVVTPPNDIVGIDATDASKNEGNSGTTNFTFTVTRSGDTSAGTTVNWEVTAAMSNSADVNDFVGGVFPSGTITFAAGETSRQITVPISGDLDIESDENFVVKLSNLSKGTLAPDAAIGTIKSDDAEIRGVKWYDANQDGVKDINEPGLAGWTIFVDENQNGLLDNGEVSTTTATDGSYTLGGLTPGTYSVLEVAQTGWKPTFPSELQGEETYQLDDGDSDARTFSPSGGDFAVFNSFEAQNGLETINFISILRSQYGNPKAVYIYQDTNNDNRLQGSEKLIEVTPNITGDSGFATISIDPTTVSGTFLVGALYEGDGVNETNILFDNTNPAGKSFLSLTGAGQFDSNNVFLSNGGNHNFLIRAHSGAIAQQVTVNAGEVVTDINFGNYIQNTTPVGNDDAVTTDENSSTSGNVLTNDTDADNDTLSVIEVNGSTANVGNQIALTLGGLLTLNSDGTFTYNPNSQFESLPAGATAIENFDYTVSDNEGGTDTATATITINGVNDAPVVDNAIANQNAAENVAFSFTIPANTFSDIDTGDNLTYSATKADGSALPSWLTFNPTTGEFSGTPQNGDTGLIDIKVTATDSGNESVFDSFTLTVGNVNNPPQLSTNTLTISEGATFTFTSSNLSATDTDNDDANLIFTVSNVTGGNFEVDGVANNSFTQQQITDGKVKFIDDGNENAPSYDITVSDGSLTDSGSATVNFTNVNDAPTDIALSNLSVAENDTAAIIGNLTVTDVDSSNFTYTVNDNRFEVVNSQLKLKDGESLDFETENSINLEITATDDGNPNQSFIKSLTIAVTNVNEAPTEITLSNSSVAENDTAAVIGNLTVTDVDSSNFTYTVNDNRFEVVNSQLKLKDGESLDFETENSINLEITATDDGNPNQSFTENFALAVTNVNEAPTDIALSNSSVAENDTAAVIGNLTVTDVDSSTFTYAVNDNRFEVVNSQLKLKDGESLDFESENSINLEITATDDGNQSVTENFTITVTDVDENVNQPPTDIALSNTSVAENDTAAIIGNLTVTDVDSSNFTYSVNDNRFEVVNSQLKLKDGESLDFETESTINLSVTATDDGNPNQSFTKNFALAVTNVNEAPTDITLSNSSVAENDIAAVIGNLTVTDVDSSNFTYTVNDNRFEVVNSQLKLKDGESLDFETENSINLEITATDDGNPNQSFIKSLTIAVTNVNEAPTEITLSNSSVAENDTTAVIGNLTVTDVDSSNFTYTVNDNRFEVVNSQLKLKDGESLDFETENSISLEITATDDGNESQSFSKNFALAVTNVNETPTVDDATFTVDENSTSGTEVGIITATDPENEALTFAIANGNIDSDGDNNLAFAIDSSTGTITVNDKDDLDFEVIPTFNLEVTATDLGSLTNTADITVNLNDVSPAVFDTESNNGIFTLNGGDSTNVKFTLANNNTEKVNEVGVFVVDDENGSIDGNAPGSDGYLQAALQRSQVILSAISDRPTGFDLGDIERVLEVDSDARLGFYLVSNGTTDTALAELEANGTTNLPIFFSDSSNLEVSDLGTEGFKLNWSDEAGSTDFTNLDLSVQLTQDVPTPGTQLQGESQQELIDLTDVTGQVSVSVEVHREAAFDNLIGFYQVVDANGGIDINGDGIADFNPGDAGYEEAALTNRITGLDLLQTDNQQTSTIDGTFDGGSILASFIVVDGTVDEAVNNNAEVYFSFLGANSDGVDHIRLLGDNTFGYEDLAGGGDFDYNDMIVKVDFPTV